MRCKRKRSQKDISGDIINWLCAELRFVKSEEEAVRTDLLKKALNTISHRGPDSQGIYVSADGKIALGHTRLSIIDLEGGNQPIVNKKHKISVVVNGEFFRIQRNPSGFD